MKTRMKIQPITDQEIGMNQDRTTKGQIRTINRIKIFGVNRRKVSRNRIHSSKQGLRMILTLILVGSIRTRTNNRTINQTLKIMKTGEIQEILYRIEMLKGELLV